MMKSFTAVRTQRVLLIALSMMLVFAGPMGCTKIKAFFGDNEAIMQLATQAATARVLTEKPQWKQPAVAITDEAIKAIDSGQIVNLDGITALVVSKINMNKLTFEERVLVNLLIQKISTVIAEELKKQGVQDPSKYLVEVRKVLGWVNQTAKM